jgi:hypothetical protein
MKQPNLLRIFSPYVGVSCYVLINLVSAEGSSLLLCKLVHRHRNFEKA